MAEIRSTLDLVMERTRNLNLSEDERRAQQVNEARKAFNGLVQQYLDRLIDSDEVETRIAGIQERHALAGRSLLVEAALAKIDLQGLDGPLPELLSQWCGADVSALHEVSREYGETLTAGRDRRIEEVKDELQRYDGISGTAVRPNLEADPHWQGELERRLAHLEDKLAKVKETLISSPDKPD